MGSEEWRWERVRAGNLDLDPETFTVHLNGSNIRLTQQEFQLLALLANNAGTVLPHRYISNQLWGSGGDRESRRLSVLVSRLRALIKGVEPYQLETVRNRGYGFVLADRARQYDRQAG
jgi:two-component system KDP operon response regulator KdpE